MTLWNRTREGGLRHAIKLFMPPIAWRGAAALAGLHHDSKPDIGYVGPFRSWGEAKAASSGYDSAAIFDKTRDARLKVMRGEAVYERDSVLFDRTAYSWPLLAGLLWVASKNGSCLSVVDFGGSLGSSYFQNEVFFRSLDDVRWGIVEQEPYVEFGKEHLEGGSLRFYRTIVEAVQAQKPQVLLLSGVIMYLQSPYGFLSAAKKLGVKHIFIDRTAFIASNEDWLMVQKVPPHIFDVSYPCWFLSLEKFRQFMTDGYDFVVEFDGFEAADVKGSVFKGFILERNGVDGGACA